MFTSGLCYLRNGLYGFNVYSNDFVPSFDFDERTEAAKFFCKKRCSEKFRKFHRKMPVLESLF